MKRLLLAIAVLSPALALADEAVIGKVSVAEGNSTREACTDETGESGCGGGSALKVGDEIHTHDAINVSKGGSVRVTLNDETVIKIGDPSLTSDKGSRFYFSEGDFGDQGERKSFVGSLSFGSIWAHVKKAVAGSDQKFKVNAGKAVAGVRGTIFRVDATQILTGSSKGKAKGKDAKMQTLTRATVMVKEGRVGVEAEVKKLVLGATQVKEARHQVAGPQEISKDEWEKKFVELQQNKKIVIGDDGAKFEAADMNDADQKSFVGFE
ncbi:MAG: FecR domain-containing protein [Myxococcaceae bacterium]